MSKKLISIVLPAYREEKNIGFIYQEIKNVFIPLYEKYDYEIIYINDGSPDNSWEEIIKLCQKDEKVIGINLSRNFGKEIALTAGVEESSGDAVITMDVDGQRPAILINDFIEKWENGFEILYGVRTKMNRGFFRKLCSNLFNQIMQLISDIKFDTAITDFMLIDRTVVNYLLKYEDRNRIFRGIVISLGFKQGAIYFEEPPRVHGFSAWGFGKLYKLAIDSITSFSIFPLKLVGYFGIFVTIISILLLIFMSLSRFIFGNSLHITNTAFFVVFNLFISGIILMALGIIAIYIARIHEEVIGRPLYIVKNKINLK